MLSMVLDHSLLGYYVRKKQISMLSHCTSGPLCYRSLTFTQTTTITYMAVLCVCYLSGLKVLLKLKVHSANTSFHVPNYLPTGLELIFVSAPSNQLESRTHSPVPSYAVIRHLG